VVVEDVEDLDVGAIGEMPVGGIGLPHSRWGGRPRPDEGGAGAFLGLRGDQAWRERMRQMVAAAGTWGKRCWRWWRMLAGPAS